MTSQKSSANPFIYTVKSGLTGSNLVPALLNAAGFLLLSSLLAIIELTRETMKYDESQTIIGTISAKDQYKYVLFSMSDMTTLFALVVVVVAAIFMGISAFRFITSKKTVNVYYSLGITRDKLYFGRYISGAILLVASIAIPLLITFIINLIFIGGSAQLTAAMLYYILMFASISLTTYTITAAIFSSVGTSFEGVLFTGTLLFLPTIFFTCLQFLMSKFVYGNPYGEKFNYTTNPDLYSVAAEKLSTRFSFLSPIMHNLNELSMYGAYDPKLEGNPVLAMTEGQPYTAPNYLPAIIWLIFSAAVFFIGMLIFQKRKAEICGFIGTNKYLNSIVPFIIGFFAFTVCLYKLPLSTVVCGVIGLIIYFIIYCAIELALKRNFKLFLRGLFKFPIHASISVAIAAIFATGLFGYSSRLPDLENIQSVDVTPVGNSVLYSTNQYRIGSGMSVSCATLTGMIDNYTSEGDIKAIYELHKKLVDKGAIKATGKSELIEDDSQRNIPTTIQFVYKLKNGKEILRCYKIANAQMLADMLEIDFLEHTKETIELNFDKAKYDKLNEIIMANKNDIPENFDHSSYNLLGNLFAEKVSTTLYTADGAKCVTLNLSYEERMQLIDALKKDILAQNVQQRYFPDAPALCALYFVQDRTGAEGLESEVIADGSAVIHAEGATSPEQPEEPEEPEGPIEKIEVSDNSTVISPIEFSSNLYSITSDMVNTLSVLKSLGAEEYTVSKPKIVKAQIATVERYNSFNSWTYEYYQDRTSLFFSYNFMPYFDLSSKDGSAYAMRTNPYGLEFDNHETFSLADESTLQTLWAASRNNYYTKMTGYYVRFTLADKGGYLTMYIPKDKMPASVAQSVAEFESTHSVASTDGIMYAY